MLIRDSTQVNLDAVNRLIKYMKDDKVRGLDVQSAEVTKALADERKAITVSLGCGNRDVRVTPRLIESLSSVVHADGMKSHTSSCEIHHSRFPFHTHFHFYAGGSMSVPRPWLSGTHPRLPVILTILQTLQYSLSRVRQPKPSKKEAKQDKDEEIFEDDEDD
jgi:hypothetical protein